MLEHFPNMLCMRGSGEAGWLVAHPLHELDSKVVRIGEVLLGQPRPLLCDLAHRLGTIRGQNFQQQSRLAVRGCCGYDTCSLSPNQSPQWGCIYVQAVVLNNNDGAAATVYTYDSTIDLSNSSTFSCHELASLSTPVW